MLVKVVNDNVHPYREKWHGKEIYIDPKGSVQMDVNDAHLFLGTMPANIEIDANGIQKPTSYKMLRIERLDSAAPAPEVKKYACMACNKDLQTQSAYEAHVAETHADQLEDEDTKKEIVEKVEKRRGRPPKGVKNDSSTD